MASTVRDIVKAFSSEYKKTPTKVKVRLAWRQSTPLAALLSSPSTPFHFKCYFARDFNARCVPCACVMSTLSVFDLIICRFTIVHGHPPLRHLQSLKLEHSNIAVNSLHHSLHWLSVS